MECQHPKCNDEGDYPLLMSREGQKKRFFFCARHHQEAKKRLQSGRDVDPAERVEQLFGEKFRGATFSSFRTDPEYFNQIAERINAVESGKAALREQDIQRIQAAKKEVKTFTGEMAETGEGTMLLFGPNGVGKTHLLAASTRELIRSGMSVSAWHMTRLVNTIRATYSEAPAQELGTVQQIIDSMRESDVLVMQDINESCFKSDIRDYIFEIIDSVYREKSILMMSANLTPEELMEGGRLGEPAVTRLLEPPSCIKKMTGPSHREARKAYEKTQSS